MTTVFDLPALLPWARRAPAPRLRAHAEPAGDDEPQAGCGWFDSSRELLQGLEVREHRTADLLADELPLADWIALHLCDAPPRAA